MATICPACSAKFRDPPADVDLSRGLQCSKCEHHWIPQGALPTLDAPSLAPQFADLGVPENENQAIVTNLPVVIEAAPAPRKAPLFVDRPAPDPVKMKRLDAALTAIPVMALALALTATITFRDTVVKLIPASKAAFEMAGLDLQPKDLSIQKIATATRTRDGIRELIVRGEIHNVADASVPVPPIRLIMRSQTDADLYAWTVSAAKPVLQAGETSRFTAIARDYPEKVANVEVAFDKK